MWASQALPYEDLDKVARAMRAVVTLILFETNEDPPAIDYKDMVASAYEQNKQRKPRRRSRSRSRDRDRRRQRVAPTPSPAGPAVTESSLQAAPAQPPLGSPNRVAPPDQDRRERSTAARELGNSEPRWPAPSWGQSN